MKAKAEKQPILPVIVTNDEARVCQRCLIKWARVKVLGKVYCVKCSKRIPE